ncbi:MAG: hypothetical protein H2172_14820 [Opitutus sp.]|nr:hypothetical protein [Opitutus sp.]MCS6248006.1 hypothetical protein [Opitutus sp.]MCS6273382.1 hypothetical protein [Opitutus sp.]MCS6277448.1 hypothetical protein [Opitutus sp.]MCS6300565.1 hypothetical protein [Opitutus sp.]
MKNTLAHSLRCVLALLVIGFAVSSASAEESEKKKPKPPSAADLEKYDANKDGTLDKEEKAAMSAAKKAAADKKKAAEAAK